MATWRNENCDIEEKNTEINIEKWELWSYGFGQEIFSCWREERAIAFIDLEKDRLNGGSYYRMETEEEHWDWGWKGKQQKRKMHTIKEDEKYVTNIYL